MNQRNRSDLELIPLSLRQIAEKTKTYRLCVPNLVPKTSTWDIPERRESFTSRSAEVITPGKRSIFQEHKEFR